MPHIKNHGSYIHDFRRFDLVALCDVTSWDIGTLLRRGIEKGFVESYNVDCDEALINKCWVIVDKLGDRALVLYNHNGTYRLATLSWHGLVGYMARNNHYMPAALKP